MPGSLRAVRPWLILIGSLLIGSLVAAPLVGWPKVTRVAIVALAALLLAVVMSRPWRWGRPELESLANWTPSRRTVWTTALIVGLLLFWIVLTRFESGSINAIDFTVYYDRPLFQTSQGRLLFVETADDPARAQLSVLSVHAHWILLPLAFLYAWQASPLWLLALSVLAVVGGAVCVYGIVKRPHGGLVASACALAFVLNDNAARTLSYGFHVEVFYAWLIPLLIKLAMDARPRAFLVALMLCVAVKEDAFMLLGAVSVTLALLRYKEMSISDRLIYLAAPPLVGLLNLWAYYEFILPHFRPDGVPFYAGFWSSYGPTPALALRGMLASPVSVLRRAITSAFFTRVLVPHLYLPLAGWRWVLGVMPVAVLYGASDNAQMRAFGIYYAIVLVPFLVLGAASGAMSIATRLWTDRVPARCAAAAAILCGSLLGGITDAGYTLRPWKPEIAAVPEAVSPLADEPVLLVQSGLYPHAGYESRVQLLTREAIADPANAGALVLWAPSVNAWPLTPQDIVGLAALPPAKAMRAGLVAVRLPR